MAFKMKERSMVHGSIAHKQALKQSTFTKKSPLYDEDEPVPTEQTAPPTEPTQQVAGAPREAVVDVAKQISREATTEGLSHYTGGAYPSEFDPNASWAKSFGSNMAMAEQLSRDYQASKSLKGDAKAEELNRMFGGTWKIGSFKDEEGNVHDNVWVNEMGQSPNMRRALAIPSAQRGAIRHGEDIAGYVSTDPRTGETSEEEIANIMKHNRAFEQIEDTIKRQQGKD